MKNCSATDQIIIDQMICQIGLLILTIRSCEALSDALCFNISALFYLNFGAVNFTQRINSYFNQV